MKCGIHFSISTTYVFYYPCRNYLTFWWMTVSDIPCLRILVTLELSFLHLVFFSHAQTAPMTTFVPNSKLTTLPRNPGQVICLIHRASHIPCFSHIFLCWLHQEMLLKHEVLKQEYTTTMDTCIISWGGGLTVLKFHEDNGDMKSIWRSYSVEYYICPSKQCSLAFVPWCLKWVGNYYTTLDAKSVEYRPVE